jgi:phosphohistidine phosphatase
MDGGAPRAVSRSRGDAGRRREAIARRVYLVRHAHATEAADDAARPLSAKGRAQVRALAKFLRTTTNDAFAPAEIWHSPLVRSRETAELLARRLKLTAPLKLTPGLEPEDDPRAAAERIAAARKPIAVVGHEPQLSAVASLLVAGRAAPVAFAMKKCAVLALERDGTNWIVRWHVSPEVIT